MKLARIGRSRLEDHFGNITLSNYASAEIEGTKEELKKFETYIMNIGSWQELICESEEIRENSKGIMIYGDTYDFSEDEIKDFKEDYKDFKKGGK
jgi:hypothetical protein